MHQCGKLVSNSAFDHVITEADIKYYHDKTLDMRQLFRLKSSLLLISLTHLDKQLFIQLLPNYIIDTKLHLHYYYYCYGYCHDCF